MAEGEACVQWASSPGKEIKPRATTIKQRGQQQPSYPSDEVHFVAPEVLLLFLSFTV